MANSAALFINVNECCENVSFHECIVDRLHGNQLPRGNSINVKHTFASGKLILSPKDDGFPLIHPYHCPFKTWQTTSIEVSETKNISLSASVLLKSLDGHILLTRRAKHLRSFPGIWVPPGGHVEVGETLEETAIRELLEETGVYLKDNEYFIEPLCFFESCYPSFLEWGLPKHHHLVMYFLLQTSVNKEQLHKRIKLCTSEVDAGVWLNEKSITCIVSGNFVGMESLMMFDSNDECSLIDENVLNAVTCDNKDDVERISTGTRVAMAALR